MDAMSYDHNTTMLCTIAVVMALTIVIHPSTWFFDKTKVENFNILLLNRFYLMWYDITCNWKN